MSQFSENSNKYTALALAVTLGLHGLAGVGLANMKMLTIEPPKEIPPIEVQLLTINHEEDPEPPKPVVAPVLVPKATNPAPKAEPKPAPKASAMASPAPPPIQKLVEPPKPKIEPKEPKKEPPKQDPVVKKETIQKEIPKNKEIPPKKEPITKKEPEVDLIAQQQAQKAFELQKQKEREAKEAEERENARKAKEAKDTQDRENARKAKEAENAKKGGQGQGGQGKDDQSKNKDDGKKGGKGDDKGKDDGKKGGDGGGVLTGQDLSGKVNAHWISKPNLHGLSSEKLKGSVVVQVTIQINAKGTITSVNTSKTGDADLEREIRNAIKRGKLRPFKSEKGQPIEGKASFPVKVNLNQ